MHIMISCRWEEMPNCLGPSESLYPLNKEGWVIERLYPLNKGWVIMRQKSLRIRLRFE